MKTQKDITLPFIPGEEATEEDRRRWRESISEVLKDLHTRLRSDLDITPPIGAILPWHKSFTNTPSLPEGWVECNGQSLSDADSVYDGQTIPDLNGDERFLRGGSTSGTEQAHALEEHNHSFQAMYNITGSGYASRIPGHESAGSDIGNYSLNTTNWSTSGANTDADETRPINMSVVWIMRVK